MRVYGRVGRVAGMGWFQDLYMYSAATRWMFGRRVITTQLPVTYATVHTSLLGFHRLFLLFLLSWRWTFWLSSFLLLVSLLSSFLLALTGSSGLLPQFGWSFLIVWAHRGIRFWFRWSRHIRAVLWLWFAHRWAGTGGFLLLWVAVMAMFSFLTLLWFIPAYSLI